MLKVEGGIRVHARCLNERLELVTRVSWCSFDSKYALNWLLAQNGVSESVSYVRELLVVTPVNFILVTSIVVVVSG